MNTGNTFHGFEFFDLLQAELDAFFRNLSLSSAFQPLDQRFGYSMPGTNLDM